MATETLSPGENYLTNWMDEITKGQNFLDRVSEEKIQEIYALAYSLYQSQQYEESSYFFRLLVMARPAESKLWKGLGACLQMQKDYEEAIHCYMCCAQFSNQIDAYLYVQTADCFFALEQAKSGLKALEAAHAIAKKMGNTRVLQHVALMQQLWSKDCPK